MFLRPEVSELDIKIRILWILTLLRRSFGLFPFGFFFWFIILHLQIHKYNFVLDLGASRCCFCHQLPIVFSALSYVLARGCSTRYCPAVATPQSSQAPSFSIEFTFVGGQILFQTMIHPHPLWCILSRACSSAEVAGPLRPCSSLLVSFSFFMGGGIIF